MPHGRGHNKGFEYYMCKKFFHPNAPHNHEAKWKAEQKQEAKEKLEKERAEEYKREQERWKTRHLLSSEEERLKMELSFMYEPPPGAATKKSLSMLEKKKIDEKTGKEKGEGWSDSICYKCDKVGHFARECKAGIKFEWQKNAPRDPWAKDDPNVVDKPFGIQVIKIRCMKCEIWGHSHTDKICPKYGKAKDSDEPILQVDPDVLMRKMRQEGLKLNQTDIWANGKTKKSYDMVYSDDEEQDDLLVNLVSKMRKGKSKVSRSKKRRSDSPDKDKVVKKKKKTTTKSKKVSSKVKVKREKSSKVDVLSKVDKILELEKKGNAKKMSGNQVMEKVDAILFSDISSLATMSTKDRQAAKSKFLEEVDEVLGLGTSSRSEESSDSDTEDDVSDDSGHSEDSDSDDEEDLTEAEMRLLNLINHNKIDVKVNFPSVYQDTDCHFCRKREDNLHLAQCPVYEGIMNGKEFRDIKSKDMSVVKDALYNIRSALLKRAEALSVTSLGEVSAKNMKLLTLNETVQRKKTQSELIDEILATT